MFSICFIYRIYRRKTLLQYIQLIFVCWRRAYLFFFIFKGMQYQANNYLLSLSQFLFSRNYCVYVVIRRSDFKTPSCFETKVSTHVWLLTFYLISVGSKEFKKTVQTCFRGLQITLYWLYAKGTLFIQQNRNYKAQSHKIINHRKIHGFSFHILCVVSYLNSQFLLKTGLYICVCLQCRQNK